MKVTGLAIVPPPAAAELPKVTPELLASVLARYSRSNQGIGAILDKVDLANPDASIDRILNFVDYGHASIGGLTGGLAIALDDVSMWLAYKIFELAQMADGQESSTRYITMAATNLPTPEGLGIPAGLAPRWSALMAKAVAAYHAEYTRLDQLALAQPNLVRLPKDAKPAVVNRLRKNYALDRARYFIPLATRTNLGLVQSSRMWAVTVKHLDSLPMPEARAAAKLIRDELLKQSPRLMRHSFAEKSFAAQAGPGPPAVAARGATGGRGVEAPRQPLRPSRQGHAPDAGELCLEQHGDRRAARPEPPSHRPPLHAADPGRLLPAAGNRPCFASRFVRRAGGADPRADGARFAGVCVFPAPRRTDAV